MAQDRAFGRMFQQRTASLHTPTNAARRSLDPRYLHPPSICLTGPATGGKDQLSLTVTLFGKRKPAAKAAFYGPTPPLWQSEQLTALKSPMSTGCLKGWAGNAAICVPLSCCSITVWQELQSLLMTLPSLLT